MIANGVAGPFLKYGLPLGWNEMRNVGMCKRVGDAERDKKKKEKQKDKKGDGEYAYED